MPEVKEDVQAVIYVLRGKEPFFLLIERFDRALGRFDWRLVKGTVKPGEGLEEALAREIREEGGVLISGDPDVEDWRSLSPPCFLGDRALVRRGSIVGPNTVLSEGCLIEERAMVRGSILLRDCSVGRGSVVVRSLLGPRASVGEMVRPASPIPRGGVGLIMGEESVLGDGNRYRPGTIIQPHEVIP